LDADIDFKCPGGSFEGITAELLEKTGYRFPEAHYDMMALANLSQELKKMRADSVCRLPFCLTVEAEALGAIIKLDDMKNGPRVRTYAFSDIEVVKNITDIDFQHGRIKAVLDAAEYLTSQGETVALNIIGPFTILSSLIDPKFIFKAIRKQNETVVRVLEKIQKNIVAYTEQGLAKGVRILSYADPGGAMDIIGPQMYKQHSGRVTCNILQKLTDRPHHAVIHLCGKTSTALVKSEFCQAVRIESEENKTYLEVLAGLINDCERTRMIGHSCFRMVPWRKKAPKIWEIRLNRS